MTEGGRREGQKGEDEEDRGRKNGEDGGKELLDEAA